MKKFNEIKSRAELAQFLKIPLKKLTHILYKKRIESYYKSFEIPKKNGGTRHINAPVGDLKELQRKISDSLWNHQKKIIEKEKINTNVSHGFEKKKGIITNAEVHRNKRYVLNMDFENFFDSFHFGRVRGYFIKNRNFQLPIEVATILAQLTCYEGKLPQGAPSSPIITNLICNILDMRIVKIACKYKVDYTRYADDLTFSTNDKDFLYKQLEFCEAIKKASEQFGLSINNNKTRLLYKDSRQEVTGLVVNKKINVNRVYYKATRAMANNLYKHGKFVIDGIEGDIQQLEGRFAYINQLVRYNNKLNGKGNHFKNLNSREKQYQKFLFYKYFYSNQKPIVVTEGKTDIILLRSALKKYYTDYPKLIRKNGNNYDYKISFLNKTPRLTYFLGISQDGADTMQNIYKFYVDKNDCPNLLDYFKNKSQTRPMNPVFLVYDNEQGVKKPLGKFLNLVKSQDVRLSEGELCTNIKSNLYLLTNPLVNQKNECEIEDLFDEGVLSYKIDGKSFSRENKIDKDKHYGKSAFAGYVSNNYMKIDFSNFKPMLDEINRITIY